MFLLLGSSGAFVLWPRDDIEHTHGQGNNGEAKAVNDQGLRGQTFVISATENKVLKELNADCSMVQNRFFYLNR